MNRWNSKDKTSVKSARRILLSDKGYSQTSCRHRFHEMCLWSCWLWLYRACRSCGHHLWGRRSNGGNREAEIPTAAPLNSGQKAVPIAVQIGAIEITYRIPVSKQLYRAMTNIFSKNQTSPKSSLTKEESMMAFSRVSSFMRSLQLPVSTTINPS